MLGGFAANPSYRWLIFTRPSVAGFKRPLTPGSTGQFASVWETRFREDEFIIGARGQLVRHGRSVYFTTCQMLVQELLRAKRDLRMKRYIKKLSKFEALIIDDLGYVQQSREEMEVLLFSVSLSRFSRRGGS